MAELVQNPGSTLVTTKDINGRSATLFVGYRPAEERRFPVQKSTHKIVDVSGSRDGAQSMVFARWEGKKEQTYRLTETPEELMAIFKDAGNPVPVLETNSRRQEQNSQPVLAAPNRF